MIITDYKSFIAGVQVGRRLKVWEANATPRPVPSGRYIITESGIPIIKEKLDFGNVTVFDTDTWYDLAVPIVSGSRTYTQVQIYAWWAIDNQPLFSYYFYAVRDYPRLVVCTDDSRITDRTNWHLWFNVRTDSGYTIYDRTSTLSAWRNGISNQGISYGVGGYLEQYMPAGEVNMLPYTNPDTSEIRAYIETWTNLPMITEGG